MRVFAAILFTLVAPSAALSFRDVDAEKGMSSNEDLKIPGHSTIELCPDKKSAGFLEFARIDFTPNPPVAGQTLTVKFKATLKRQIERGAFFNLNVKYGSIRLLGMQGSLCSQVTALGLKCPLMEGYIFFLTKTITLPKNIPPGNYTVSADVYSLRMIHYVRIEERIICLTTSIEL
ncbi:hypothetical protein E4U59_002795 [Claviceps monticola]|nr:hypothetical protein E4U59_002795 [Claviceps monticola]